MREYVIVAKKSVSDVQDMIAAALKEHATQGVWFEKLSDVGKDVVAQTAAKHPAASVLRSVAIAVLKKLSPDDVKHIPSEGTVRKWLRDQRAVQAK